MSTTGSASFRRVEAMYKSDLILRSSTYRFCATILFEIKNKSFQRIICYQFSLFLSLNRYFFRKSCLLTILALENTYTFYEIVAPKRWFEKTSFLSQSSSFASTLKQTWLRAIEYSKWGLKINLNKMEYLVAGEGVDFIQLELNIAIKPCTQYRYLARILIQRKTSVISKQRKKSVIY